MNKRTALLLQVAVWAILFLSPLSFLNHGNGVNLLQYLMACTGTVLMMVVFYSNLLWLTPRYFMTGEKKIYWIVNILMCILFAVGLHVWMNYYHHHYDSHPHPALTLWQHLFFILREVINQGIAAAIATTILLSLRWYKSEEARLEAEAARTEAELKNLRNQINPHFLLNTLNNIYALTAFDSQRAQTAIEHLSKMLRHMLYENQQPTVSLDAEVQFLQNYVDLMKIRLSNNVDVTFTTQYSNPNLMVAPLLFISLVENAFKHGISPTAPSFIHISIQADEQQLTFDIENSNHPKSEQDRSGHGIGLSQVQRRLDLAYAGRYQWSKGVANDGQTYRSRICISPLN